MIYRHDLTSELPVSALRLRQLIQDPEQLLKLSTDVREIRQNEAGDWELTEYLSVLRFRVSFVARLKNTEKGVVSECDAPMKVRTHSEWTVEELAPQEGQEARCSAREVATFECPWYVYSAVKSQVRKTHAAMPQRFLEKLQQQEGKVAPAGTVADA